MKNDGVVVRRFDELAKLATELEAKHTHQSSSGLGLSTERFYEWSTSVLSLLQRTFGQESDHYRNFREMYAAFSGWFYQFTPCRGIFLAAKEDYEGGYLFTVRSLIKAEDSADVLDEASTLLTAGYKDPACILAGVALEIALKELCIRKSISHSKLDAMNVELCKASVYNMGMQKQITAWAHWRNKAAHGEFGEYKDADVKSMIEGVTRFVADYL